MSDNWNVIIGSPDDDDISGTSGNDIIFAGPGDDLITPGEGNDVVFGGGDFDTVRLEGSLSDYDIQTFWWFREFSSLPI
jgi:Ca2+-binding RTX toxin-like protein